MSLNELTLAQLKKLLEKKEISSVDICKDIFKKIEHSEDKLNSFLHIEQQDDILKQAETIDKKRANNESSDYAGIPIAIKDNICTKDIKTTCASKILYNFVPPYNATVISKLLEKEFIIFGKTNNDEFCLGSSTESSAFKTTKNPYDLARVPGGSSGGSSAAVAANQTIAALGSDTGGSIRQPASFCSVVGVKPTYGRVSRFGLIAFGSSLDQIGPLTKTVEDSAILLEIIAGHDKYDSTSIDKPVNKYTESLNNDITGKVIGIPDEYFTDDLNPEMKDSIMNSIKKLEKAGAKLERISMPHTKYAVPAYYIIACAELSSNLGRFDGVKFGYRSKEHKDLIDMYCKSRAEGFGAEVKRRLMLGTFVLSSGYYDEYYNKALKVRTLLKQDFEKAFKKCDVIITPVSPIPAFKIGEKTDNPVNMYLADIFSVTTNLAGVPAVAVPCDFTNEGLPIGFQIIGDILQESTILNFANIFEQENDTLNLIKQQQSINKSFTQFK